MSVTHTPWIVALLTAASSAGFAWLVRLPLPFEGFAIIVAGTLAALGTLTLIAWLPPSLVWTDAERLRLAFAARHDLSDGMAGAALAAIVGAHARAARLRQSASVMRDDMASALHDTADRLDAAAREIFYVPARQRALRTVLVRSELIEEAAQAHAALRKRGQTETEDLSRDKLLAAVGALDAAFDQTDLMAARGLLQDVTVASDVAERLLTPRRRGNLTSVDSTKGDQS